MHAGARDADARRFFQQEEELLEHDMKHTEEYDLDMLEEAILYR